MPCLTRESDHVKENIFLSKTCYTCGTLVLQIASGKINLLMLFLWFSDWENVHVEPFPQPKGVYFICESVY